MNELQVFNFEQSQVRVIEQNGETWFVGKDVCDVLGYSNPSKALIDHVDEEDKLNNESLLSLGQRGGWLINESGLYSLILSSKLPTAKQFKRWITFEVIPSIRKHGMYLSEPVKQFLKDNPVYTRTMEGSETVSDPWWSAGNAVSIRTRAILLLRTFR